MCFHIGVRVSGVPAPAPPRRWGRRRGEREPQRNSPSSVFLPRCGQGFQGGRRGFGLCGGPRGVPGARMQLVTSSSSSPSSPHTAGLLIATQEVRIPVSFTEGGGTEGLARIAEVVQGSGSSCRPKALDCLPDGQRPQSTLGNPAPHPGSPPRWYYYCLTQSPPAPSHWWLESVW